MVTLGGRLCARASSVPAGSTLTEPLKPALLPVSASVPSCTCTASGVPPPLLPTAPDKVHLPSPVLISDWKLLMVPGKVSLDPSSPASDKRAAAAVETAGDDGTRIQRERVVAAGEGQAAAHVAPLRLMKLTLPLPLLPMTLLLVPLPAWMMP